MKCLLCSVFMFVLGVALGGLSKEPPKIVHERSGLEAEATRSDHREVEPRDLLSTYLLAWPELEFEAHWYVIQTLALYPREVLKRLLAAQWVVEDGPSAYGLDRLSPLFEIVNLFSVCQRLLGVREGNQRRTDRSKIVLLHEAKHGL